MTVLFGVTARREIESWTDEAALARHVADIDPCNERASVAMGDEARRAGAPVADLVQWYGAVARKWWLCAGRTWRSGAASCCW